MRDPRSIYLVAIGGTGMAPLACLLKDAGYEVTGSDGPIYPPMSTLLEAAGIEPLVGYDPANLDRADPDLVVIGNAVPRTHVEAEEVEKRGIERISMPQALARFFLDERKPLVIAGTHGKTTTTSLAAWAYTALEHDPGYLIGGIPVNLDQSFEKGTGDRFIIEGDEYNAAYFDRGPKFLHYQPQTLILTSVEWDHADLYPDHESLLNAYRKLVSIVPEGGTVLACGTAPHMDQVLPAAKATVFTYGIGDDEGGLDLRADDLEADPSGQRFVVKMLDEEAVPVHIRISGRHNVENALAVYGALRLDGYLPRQCAEALRSFAGVKRRMEVVGEVNDVLVIDDFAHHPTAVETTLRGARAAYPDRRFVALFEPRSLTAGREMFLQPYVQAFAQADAVFLAPIFHADRLAEDQRLDRARLVDELTEAGVEAVASGSNDELLDLAIRHAQPGDLVITMSSGSFDGLPRRLLTELENAK